MKTMMRNIAFAIGMSGIIGCTSVANIDSQQSACAQGNRSSEADLLKRCGEQLRSTIEREYQRLVDSKTLTPRNGGDISAQILKFIPVGTTFDDAEQILRSAGFEVGIRYSPNTKINFPVRLPSERYALTARIINLDHSLVSLLSFRTVTVIASLIPRDPDNYDKVNEVSASVFLSYP